MDRHRNGMTAAFINERRVVNGLQDLTHDHIIKLLGTYEQDGGYHFLFPFAEKCLEELMKTDPEFFGYPNSYDSKEYTAWIIEQFAGIASGLENLHRSQKRTIEGSEGSSTKPTFLDTPKWADEKRPDGTGYHHDIKPQNLLLFKKVANTVSPVSKHGIIQISDFGVSKFHREQSGSGTKTFRGTETYAAPESKIPQLENPGDVDAKLVFKLSRPYDIWSLGCVLMEVLVWIVLGTKGWESFNVGRFGPVGDDDATESDGYCYIINSKPKTAKVRDEVRDWMKKLREESLLKVKGGCLAGLLDLIEEKVLLVDPSSRLGAKQLKEELQDLALTARSEANKSTGLFTTSDT